ncbi:T9SS type B sorting domain-containing protein [Rufibacter psychrotolerans]|uniref:T9SS type B sorting domain-containing protein n=1 Tax=Rufibacter psychrotolerans TaxID=2812556 RepID=UPI0019680A26|nr:T9SS type B sorting domain-containing protein [Rufibacter sp. SYSU D00308]
MSIWVGFGAQAQAFLAYNQQNQPVTTFCVGEPITFKDNSGRPNVTEYYDFDARDGVTPDQPPRHVFTTPGTYTVTQLTGVGVLNQREFEVKAAEPAAEPVLQRLTVQATSILVQLQTSGVNDLVVERATGPSGTFTAVKTLAAVPAGQSQHPIDLAPTEGCYRVRVTNVCSGREDIVSSVVCAQALTVTAGDRRNQLTWPANPSGGVASYQLLRGGQPYQTIPGSQTSFTDQQVACGRQYTYQLVAVLANGAQSASPSVPVETQGTTPPAAPFLVASFDLNNKVVLETVVPAQETFREQAVYRSQAAGVYSLLLEKQPQNAVDGTVNSLTAPLCYQVAYTDSCNLGSGRSNAACPSLLRASLQADGKVQLDWSPYEGFPTGVESQTLELVDEQGTVYWSTPVTGQGYLDAEPQTRFQRLTYRLRSTSQNAQYQSYSNTAVVDQAFQFHFPTAFTPNQDGLNDLFRPVGAPFASKFTLQVLNRWGQIIFESKDPQAGWDGQHNGKPAPPETYLYRLEAVDVNGKRITQKGTITLIR